MSAPVTAAPGDPSGTPPMRPWAAASPARAGTRDIRVPDRWIILALVALAVLSRIFTTNSLAGEPTSDEYMFGVHARDLARGWTAGGEFSLGTLGGEGRSVAVEAAALSFLLPWDHVTLGRTIQVLFNALC